MSSVSKNTPVIVTGLSGAGISSVLKTLEDFGLEAFDNFPLNLIESLLNDTSQNKRVAIGIDSRTRGFDPQEILETSKKIGATLIFMNCDEAVLYNRFTETRRKHPLAPDSAIADGIQKERALLDPLLDNADLTIDSTHLSIHDLRHILEGHFQVEGTNRLTITLMSFGFKNGIPREADIVMDVRFLKNPHWEPTLKPKTGKDKDVGDYIESDTAFAEFTENFKGLIKPLLPSYQEEGKSYLTIAIGCTGGRHRSVYTVEKLSQWLKDQEFDAKRVHRDLKA